MTKTKSKTVHKVVKPSFMQGEVLDEICTRGDRGLPEFAFWSKGRYSGRTLDVCLHNKWVRKVKVPKGSHYSPSVKFVYRLTRAGKIALIHHKISRLDVHKARLYSVIAGIEHGGPWVDVCLY